MSLISLLIALAAERYLPSAKWQFATFYRYYLNIAKFKNKPYSETNEKIASAIFVLAPTVGCYLLITLVDSDLFTFVLSTLVLIVCLGCSQTRDAYRKFLQAAFRGELTTCDCCHQQLISDKKLANLGLGQTLIWLNYRYFIAVMFFFVLFGAPGAILYRLLVTIDEQGGDDNEAELVDASACEQVEASLEHEYVEQHDEPTSATPYYFISSSFVLEQSQKLLTAIDWVLIRIVAFAYMLVGHFSRALPVWLDYVFNAKKPAYQLLADVAEKSEDIMLGDDDCTAEPCTLVRLAKRTLLLCLVMLSLLIVTGVIS